MGKIKIGINGFGRIGRNAFKIAFERSDIEIVAINDPGDAQTLADLLKNDVNYGEYQRQVGVGDGHIIVDDKRIDLVSTGEFDAPNWEQLGVDIVVESIDGASKDSAMKHILAGAKRVVIGAPNDNHDVKNIVIGVNEDKLGDNDLFVGNANPMTHAISPLISILDAEFGAQKTILTNIASYDTPESTVAGIVPMLSNAANVPPDVLPEQSNKLGVIGVRVPASVVSVCDVTVLLGRNTTADEVNDVIAKAAKEPFYIGILDVSSIPSVSKDYIGNSHSGVVDLSLTKVAGGNLAKIMVWYDNEWGYSNRLVELVADIGRNLHN